MATVLLTTEAQADFDKLPRKMKARVMDVFDRLAQWPQVSGAKPLRHGLAGHFRIRTGDWRVIFRVDERGQVAIVTVTKIANRKDVYE